jgi:flagellar basal body-associated protein FliL
MASDQKKSSPILMIVLSLAWGMVGGAAGMFWYRSLPRNQSPESENKVRAVLHLETFTIDRSSVDRKAYLRVGIDVGLTHDLKTGDGTSTVLVRDTVLGALMAARPDELFSSEGKQKLKDHILEVLRQRAPDLGVQEVHFTEFLMQR